MRNLNPPPPNSGDTYYVIVGCGVTAAVNYTTLLTLLGSGSDPFGAYEVLFIGQPEPWGEYNPLPMGQWPAILAAPSFQEQLHSIPQNDFVPSAEFSRGIDDQWAWLYGQRPFRYSPGFVTSITPNSVHGFDVAWEENGSTYRVHAAHLDVCGGPGPSRRLCENQVDASLWPYPQSPRLETGESYLGKTAHLAGAGERVAVIGGGPTAAWCVERALANSNEVLWVSDKDLNPAFVSSCRNDTLAQTPLRRERQDRSTNVTYSVFPRSPHLVFAEFYGVDSVHDGGSSVDVEFTANANSRHVNYKGWHLGRLQRPESFAQVVLALGQETGFEAPCRHVPSCSLPREANSWATRLGPILSKNPRNHLIVRNRMQVGLKSDDGTLRVLGAAFLAHPYADAVFRNIDSELFRYVGSLTEQAQVNRGAATATITTALANGYFHYCPNRNRNGATLDQLQALPVVGQYAKFVHDGRSQRIHPVTEVEAYAVHQFTRDRCS